MNSNKMIPISALIVFGTMTLADIQAKQRLPNTREWLGFVTVYTLTSAGADLGLPVAGGFAVLIMLTMFLTRGGEALQFITGNLKENKKAKAKATAPALEAKKV